MTTTLTESQLKSALTTEQITRSRSHMGTGETVDPVEEEISAAMAKVDTYCTGYVVAAGLLTGWARDIAAHQVAKRLDTPTDAQVRAYERALKELEDVRDGKFKNLEIVVNPAQSKVKSGGRRKVI